MTRDELLKLLKEDKEIKKAILKIKDDKNSDFQNCKDKDEEIQMLKGMIENFKNLLSNKEKKEDELLHKIAQKDEELQDILSIKNRLKEEIEKLEQEKNQKEKEISFYKNSFEEELRVYEIYKNLSEDTKDSLKGIFKDDSLKGFLSCGVQEKNIDSLWEYIKYEIIENRVEELDSLKTIFYFFFERFILAYPIYQKQIVNVGDTFDTHKYINANSLIPSGDIKEVLLYGWINTKTDKIIKKSVVRL